MGEMADFAIDNAFADMEHYDKYSSADLATQYDEGLIDELGVTIGEPWSIPAARHNNFTPASRGPHGYGDCPDCGSKTELNNGIYGKFYGCTKFPSCKGSRGK